MDSFEYKVVPAPEKGVRGKGVRGPKAKFALALETVMNELAADGWEYQRTDTLPAEERQGLTSKVTIFQNMLVFRRVKTNAVAAAAPKALPAPEPDAAFEFSAAPNVTPLFGTEPDEPQNYDGPLLNPAITARAARVKAAVPDDD